MKSKLRENLGIQGSVFYSFSQNIIIFSIQNFVWMTPAFDLGMLH